MKTLFKTVFCLFAAAAALTGCSKPEENNGYEGKNQIYITTEDDPVLIESDTKVISAKIALTVSADAEYKMDLVIKNLTNDIQDIVKIEPSTVVIPAGEKTGTFQISSLNKNLLKEDVQLEFTIEHLPAENMEIKESLKVRIKPDLTEDNLSDEQRALLAGYKEKGLDLKPWLGIVPVKVRVEYPGNGTLDPFLTEFTREYEGKTVITLSDSATVEQPVIKMTDNPMGLSEYLYWVFRQETIENAYWYGEYASPLYKQMMDLIGLSKDSQETFTTTLDNIRIMFPEGGLSDIEYIGYSENSYYDPQRVVPFEYTYTAWDRLKKLYDEGNEQAIECVEQGASLRPTYYLVYSSIDSDEWENEPSDWMETKGQLDAGNGKMTFEFCMDHMSSGGYTRIFVEFTQPKQN